MFKLLRVRILVAVGAILFATGSAVHALHTTQGLHGAIRGDRALDPGTYRPEIVDIEALLFAPAPLSMEDRIRLAQSMDVLARDLHQRGGSDMALYGSRELGTLAGISRGLGPLDGAALANVRGQWMRIRSNTFQDDAAWFRFSENDPIAARAEPKIALSNRDRALATQLTSRLDQIEDLIARGTRDCDRLGEPSAGMDDVQGETLARSWQEWSESWRRDVASLRSWMPESPEADAPATVRFAFSAAEEALSQLEAVPDAGNRWNAPYRQDWERHFQNAAKQVRDARSWIERAGKGLGV